MAATDRDFQQWLTQVGELWASTGIGYIDPETRIGLQNMWDAAANKGALLAQLRSMGNFPERLLPFVQQHMAAQQAAYIAPGLGQPAPGATPAATPSPQPGQSPTPTNTNPAAGGQLTEQSRLTQQQYIDLMRLWGLSSPDQVDQMVSAFRNSYSVTYKLNQSADFVGGPGVTFGAGTPTATKPSSPFALYQQEATALGTGGVGMSPWTMALSPLGDVDTEGQRAPGTARRGAQNIATAQDVYAAVMYSSGSGGIAMRILQQYREKYLNSVGHDMPPDLYAQLQAAIQGLSASDQQQWLEQSIARPGASLSIGALDDIVSLYEAKNPTKTQQEAETYATILAAFQKAFNRAPTTAELAALGPNPTPAAIQQYINSLPMPGTSLSYGQYTSAQSNMTSLWSDNFGRPPTNQELVWGAGKTPEELLDFIDNSPSHVKGVTIGRYNDYINFIDGLGKSGATTHAFSAGIDDSLIADLHHNLSDQPKQTQQPGKMT